MVVRKRLIFWLIRAYIRKSGKVILLAFSVGLITFFLLLFASKYVTRLMPVFRKTTIGLVGAYTIDNLPTNVVSKLSRGLTSIDSSGEVMPDLASAWDITDNGKTYIFHLKKDQYFSNGSNVTSDLINYNFSDVSVVKPDKYTIIFKLKDAYSPFLVTVSRPLFRNPLTGTGDYKIEGFNLNGDFVQTLSIANVNDRFDTEDFQFYPSQDALKYAYVLGEISQATGLDDVNFNATPLTAFNNSAVRKYINYDKLVTLFYNFTDNLLADKKIRLALSYALPNDYSFGKKAYLPYSPESVYYNKDLTDKKQDYQHAKLLLSASSTASGSANIRLTIKTLPKYKPVADEIAKSFTNIDITTDIKVVDSIPSDFQIYLGDFNLSKDPDQYTLWHSGQPNNITRYSNLRIDKLLEDGRKTVDENERIKIYTDFQKYLADDEPASFLYFPYQYDVKRK